MKMIGKEPICLKCEYYNKKDYEKFSCKAYPNGIPIEILEGEIDHTKPYKGDKGIQFKKLFTIEILKLVK